jgi:hypothetical protein
MDSTYGIRGRIPVHSDQILNLELGNVLRRHGGTLQLVHSGGHDIALTKTVLPLAKRHTISQSKHWSHTSHWVCFLFFMAVHVSAASACSLACLN